MGHLDHGLRGAAGAADALFVAAMAEELGLPFAAERADVAAQARAERRSMEDAARRARYAFLRRVAQESGAARICTGHTRDDQAETVILHFLRGSGLAGLAGMAPLEGDLARPLLDVARAETEAYCAARGWVPRQDATNADVRFARNRVRRELLPLLETYNPNVRATLARNAALIAADDAYLEVQANAAWDGVARVTGDAGISLQGELNHRRMSGTLSEPESPAPSSRREPATPAILQPNAVALDLEALGALPPALRFRVYRRAVRVLSGENGGLEARHVALIERLLLGERDGEAHALPGSLRVRREGDVLRFVPADAWAAPARAPRVPARKLEVPGMVDLPEVGWRVRSWLVEEPPGLELGADPPPPELPPFARAGDEGRVGHAVTRAYLAPEMGAQPLTVRTWRPGDRFRPMGMAQEKKLQDYFADAKVPREVRSRLPLVFGPDHLLWIAGLRLDDRAKLGPQARGALILQLEPLSEPRD